MASEQVTQTTVGDFVLAMGVRASEQARGLGGLSGIPASGHDEHAAVRGKVQHGAREDGTRWLVISDLVRGEAEEIAGVLEGEHPQRQWRGRFAAVVWNAKQKKAAVVTDQFSTLSVYVCDLREELVAATDLRLIAGLPGFERRMDLCAVYHYLNFGHVPAPRTVFAGVSRVEPGTLVRWTHGRTTLQRYYLPAYPEDLRGAEEALSGELRERMTATVRAYRPANGHGWGCFLSGGTDSTSIVSILSREGGAGTVRSYSIGFSEEGYDELGFARIAARASGARSRSAVVSSEQTLRLVSRLVEGFDQPFGGASAVATIACGDLARSEGVEVLLAGDGGDEIFGGNARYAKDEVMEAWYAMPGAVKAAGKALGGLIGESRYLLLNRVENFFERASLPNPERFYTDDSFASDHYERLLTEDFRRAVPRDASLEFLRSVYELGDSGGRLHRLMRLDLLMAIAQHDIRKVHYGARESGVGVRFPYLDPDLVDWVNRLPERHKVRGLRKRYLFSRAMRGVVPEEILKKKKQGFGMPIAVWLRREPQFRDAVRDTLGSGRSRSRGWWNAGFLDALLTEHVRGSWDHSDYLWRLFVLELWLRRYVDAA